MKNCVSQPSFSQESIPINQTEIVAFISKHGRGTRPTINFLIEHNMRLITYCRRIAVRRWGLPIGITRDDLQQDGYLALEKAAAGYDPLFSTAFSTYACNGILRAIRATIVSWYRKNRRDHYCHCQLRRQASSYSYVGEQGTRRELSAAVLKFLKETLSCRDFEIVSDYFGIGDRTPQSQTQIAARVGLATTTISLVIRRSLAKAKRYLHRQFVTADTVCR